MPKGEGVIVTPGLLDKGFKTVEEQIDWFTNYSIKGESAEVENMFSLYMRGLNHEKRKHFIKAVNVLFAPGLDWLEKFVFSQFESEPSSGVSDWLEKLAVCLDGPSNSVVTIRFLEWLNDRIDSVFRILGNILGKWTDRTQSELLLTTRLMQSLSSIGKGKINPSKDLEESLIEMLSKTSEDTLRDLTTVVGYLLCMHFPENAIDRSDWSPLPRMSVRRGLVATCTIGETMPFNETLEFYASFMENVSATAMDLHYAIQSIHLLLIHKKAQHKNAAEIKFPKVSSALVSIEEGSRICEICLLRWDHTVHMVSANCRSLFGLLCSMASPSLLDAIALEASSLSRQSKKRFNLLFGLLPFMKIPITDELVADMMESLYRYSPCGSAVKALLESILVKTDKETVERFLAVPVPCNFDWDVFIGCFARTNWFPLLVDSMTRRKEILVLARIVEHLFQNSLGETAVTANAILYKAQTLLTIDQVSKLVLSNDPEIVAKGLTVVLRCLGVNNVVEWKKLVRNFFLHGGVETVSACKDERSIALQELKKFFDKTANNCDDLFSIVWEKSFRPESLEDECLLGTELLASLRPGRLQTLLGEKSQQDRFVNDCLTIGLTSRWRRIRLNALGILNALNIGANNEWLEKMAREKIFAPSISFEDEVLVEQLEFFGRFLNKNDIVNEILKHCISDPNINAITALNKGEPLLSVMSYLLAVIVLHSQTVGEFSLDSILEDSQGILSVYESVLKEESFRGTVDCRGHPTEANGERLSVKAWTCAKVASNCLERLIGSHTIASESLLNVGRIVAILLLSVKHPAEIAPLECLLGTVLRKLGVESTREFLLDPLIDSISEETSVFKLPMALRRSQGLGPLISCIVRVCGVQSVVSSVVNSLLPIIQNSIEDEECVVHSLNVLRAIVQDSSISDQLVDPIVSPLMVAGIDILDRLSEKYWRIRSSATQLFVQSARRFLGSDNNKTISASEFFNNRTGGGQDLEEKIIGILSTDKEFIQVPVLSVVQSLSGFGNTKVLKKLLFRTNSCHVRRLCAVILAKNGNADCDLDWKGNSWNELHASLLLWSYIVKAKPEIIVPEAIVTKAINLLKSECPSLVFDEAVVLLSSIGRVPNLSSLPTTTVGRIYQFVCSNEDQSEPLVVGLLEFLEDTQVADPVFRERLLQFVLKLENIERILTVWLKSGFDLGIASLITKKVLEEKRVEEWLLSLDLLNEDCGTELKIALASNEFVGEKFPHVHALLCLDESPAVRSAACKDGFNFLETFGQLTEKCCSEFLLNLLAEPLKKTESNSILEYCIRTVPREIAANELHSRGYLGDPKVIIDEGSECSGHRRHSLGLLKRLGLSVLRADMHCPKVDSVDK
jgi:hypothetical protein